MPKKLVIPKELFVEQDAYDPNHYLRFRIITDDQNKFSYWSPIFTVKPKKKFVQGTFSIPGRIIAEKSSNYATLAWDSVNIYKYSDSEYSLIGDLGYYDLWIQFGSNNMQNAGPWIYKERLSSTSVNVIIPSQYSYIDSNGDSQLDVPRQMKIEIHRPVRPAVRYSPNRVVFFQDPDHINLVDDTILFDENHGFNTGDAVGYYLYNISSSVLPLVDGGVYWVRSVDFTTISLHPTESDAANNTNKINLTSTGQGAGVFVKDPFLQNSTTVNLVSNTITTSYSHNFKSGDPVIYNSGDVVGGLEKETLYWVGVHDTDTFSLHTSNAESLTLTNPIDFTTTGSGYGTMAILPSILYKTSLAI